MFGGDQRRSRNPRWSATSGQQGEPQQLPTQPSSSTSGMVSGAPSFYDPNVVDQQPQPSLDDQWLHPAATQQYAPGLDTGAYNIPYRQQSQSSRALHHESFTPQQQRTVAQPQQLSQTQQQAAPQLLNQYNFVVPQYQPPPQTQFPPLDHSAATNYRPQVLNQSYLYGQVPLDPTQNASRVENYPYSQQFQFFNSPLSELANNATPSSSSSELLAHQQPHGPSVSPAISDRSSQQNASGITPPPPVTSKTSTANPVVTAAAESNTARNKAASRSKKRKSAKRPRIEDDSTTDTDEEDGDGADFSIHLTQPPRGSEFVFPTRL